MASANCGSTFAPLAEFITQKIVGIRTDFDGAPLVGVQTNNCSLTVFAFHKRPTNKR